jgi:hypothetical protein
VKRAASGTLIAVPLGPALAVDLFRFGYCPRGAHPSLAVVLQSQPFAQTFHQSTVLQQSRQRAQRRSARATPATHREIATSSHESGTGKEHRSERKNAAFGTASNSQFALENLLYQRPTVLPVIGHRGLRHHSQPAKSVRLSMCLRLLRSTIEPPMSRPIQPGAVGTLTIRVHYDIFFDTADAVLYSDVLDGPFPLRSS